jgi:endonuclease/exonuclease/phosphatase family metal-dependent hydrolase
MRTAAFAIALLVSAAPVANAQTQTLRSYRDGTIRGGSYANMNYGDDPILETRASSDESYVRRAVLMFATAESLPSTANISSAKLVVTVKSGNPESRTLTACAVPVSFREPYLTWRMRDSGSGWQHAGGDVVAGDCETATVTATAGSQVVFDVTREVQKAVRGDYGSRYARFLVGDSGASSRDSYKQYYSNNDPNTSVQPALVITQGGTTTTTTSTPPPVETTTSSSSTSTSSSTTLRVLQWNTHHGGYGTDGVYDPNRLANWIVKMNPDIISLNEIEYYTGWGNEDQPARFAALLQQKTGQTWYYKFATASGAATGDGNLVLSKYPFDVKDSMLLSYTRVVVQVQVHVNGRTVSFFSTHLDDASTTAREAEISQLQSWASGITEQRIIAGDFNAWPGTPEINMMAGLYYDSWAEAAKTGTAIGYPGNTDGRTRNTRIDYVWYSHSATALRLQSVQVFDTADASGVMPSDHRPVLAIFTIQ